MEEFQALGSPFNVEHSSCSDLKPKKFKWTMEDRPVKVFIDDAIMPGLSYEKKPGEKKIAWVCESRAVFHALKVPRDTWVNNLEKVCDHYDVVFTSEKEHLSIHPKIQFAYAGSNLPWIKPKSADIIIQKKKLCSLIASPKAYAYGHQLRHRIADIFKDNIDLYGGVRGSPRVEGIDRWDKSPALLDYMFSFVIENDNYSTYYTEKLTDCFMTGTIPIYWGTSDIGEIFDMNGIVMLSKDIDLKSLTWEFYESKLDSIYENYQRCINLEMADDYLYTLIDQL
jgi:hypothetical protein